MMRMAMLISASLLTLGCVDTPMYCRDERCQPPEYTCANGICVKSPTTAASAGVRIQWNHGDPNCQHEMGPNGPKYEQRGMQKRIGERLYDCYDFIPMVRWACKKCGAMGSDVRDQSKNLGITGPECDDYLRDLCVSNKK